MANAIAEFGEGPILSVGNGAVHLKSKYIVIRYI
jgi:hypothetical protein